MQADEMSSNESMAAFKEVIRTSRSEIRLDLASCVPLKQPLVLYIDPINACNFRCSFCPNGEKMRIREIGRNTSEMRWRLFEKIVGDLRSFEKPIKTIYLYKDGEPLLNKRLEEMVYLLKQSGVCDQIAIITNGSLLNRERNLALIEAGLDKVIISVEGMSEESYKKISNYNIDFGVFVDNVRHLFMNKKRCRVYAKIIGDYLTDEEKESFHSTFGKITDLAYVEHIVDCWPGFEVLGSTSREGVGIFGQLKKERDVCPFIFYSLAVNVDGQVSVCHADWARELIVGDLNDETLKNLWEGSRLRYFQLKHLKGCRSDIRACKSCRFPENCAIDNLDSQRKCLLSKLERNG